MSIWDDYKKRSQEHSNAMERWNSWGWLRWIVAKPKWKPYYQTRDELKQLG
jgi:hypothetical protein